MRSYYYSVFLNCPFDVQYKPIFDALVFAIFDCGFVPRCALEEIDSAVVRIEKILSIIEKCAYGVHDISRVEIDSSTGFPRFNMPFELGLFLGAMRFGSSVQRVKKCLILDAEPYRYKKFISDISGQDILYHHNEPKKAVECVRNWLRSASGVRTIPGVSSIWARYMRFLDDLPRICRILRLKPEELTFNDYAQTVYEWLRLYG